MKIIRWLLSHIFLILLIVVVIYGYMFWGKLTDADTPGGKAVAYLSDKFAPVEKFVNETKAKQAKLSDESSIEGNGQEGEEQEGNQQSIATDMGATSEDAASETVAGNIESSMLDRRSEFSVDNAQLTIDDTTASASAVDVNKDTFVSPDVEAQLNRADVDGSTVDTSNVQPFTNQQSEISVNGTQLTIDDTTASANAVDVNKDTFVSPDVEAQLNRGDSVGTTVDTSNAQPLTNQQSDVSVNDERFVIDDTNASADAVEINKDTFVSPDVEAQLNSVDVDGSTVDTSNAQPLTNQQSEVSVNDKPLTIGDAVASAGANAVEIVKDFFLSPEIEEQLKNADADATGEAVAANQQSTNEQDIDVKVSWITARESYFQRNYELSEKSYQQVIDNTEDNYDAYGELGNVYFNQGKNIQAASAYYEAAAIFVRTGHLPRAKSLIGLLRRLDKSKADELQQLIDTTSS